MRREHQDLVLGLVIAVVSAGVGYVVGILIVEALR